MLLIDKLQATRIAWTLCSIFDAVAAGRLEGITFDLPGSAKSASSAPRDTYHDKVNQGLTAGS